MASRIEVHPIAPILGESEVNHTDGKPMSPAEIHFNSILEFPSDRTPAAVYGELRRGKEIWIMDFTLHIYEKERPSVILSESPMALIEETEGEWRLFLVPF